MNARVPAAVALAAYESLLKYESEASTKTQIRSKIASLKAALKKAGG